MLLHLTRWKKEKISAQLRTQVRRSYDFSWSNFALGPGTYAAENVKVVATVKDMMSNSFTTKVSCSIKDSYDYRFQDSVQLLQVQVYINLQVTFKTQDQAHISRVSSSLEIRLTLTRAGLNIHLKGIETKWIRWNLSLPLFQLRSCLKTCILVVMLTRLAQHFTTQTMTL